MYAAIYSYDYENGRRKHLGNITDIEYTVALRTYDFSTATVKGKSHASINRELIYVIKDDRGRDMFAGFIKNTKPEKDYLVSFLGDDFKKVLDTDVLLDFSNIANLDFTLSGIFAKVTNAVRSAKDPFITKLDIDFIIPSDTTDTKVIADYTGQYIVVNATKFLKVYLGYYGYYIDPYYDVILDRVVFEFKKMSNHELDIKLKDFVHEKTSADIKVNKTVATIKYNTIEEDASWLDSNVTYYNSQPFSNKASIMGSDLPEPSGYPVGFALQKIEELVWEPATQSEYNSAPNSGTAYVLQYGVNVCYTSPTFNQAVSAAGSPNRTPGTVVRALIKIASTGQICMSYPTYIKVVPTGVTYHQASDITYKPRPNLPEKVYTLGTDNQIYEGYAPEDKRIYPIVSKIFESTYLSEAQLNAVYEIVNNRYVENIIITQNNMLTTLDLAALELYTPIKVYDEEGAFKIVPISEKTYTYSESEKKVDIKLGFKKTLLTEIIKSEVGLPEVVKSSGGGGGSSTTIIEQYEIWSGESAPNPNDYNTWFKPINTSEMQMMSFGFNSGELEVNEMSNEYQEPVEEPDETEELEVEGASPYEST